MNNARVAKLLLPILLTCAPVILGVMALLFVIVAVMGPGTDSDTSSTPSELAISDIPADYLAIYQKAGVDYKTDWWVLAGIGKVETNHGRSNLPGVKSGVNSYGCCSGPMQFMISRNAGCRQDCYSDPSKGTWEAYRVDGNKDGTFDVYDPNDAIPAAANYTKANGAPGNWEKALFQYNRSHAYYVEVMGWADKYRTAASAIVQTPVGSVNPAALALNPNLQFQHACARAEFASGSIAPVLVAAIATIVKTNKILIYALACDHSPGTNHQRGRAADIAVVDGQVCNGSRDGKCGKLAVAFTTSTGPLTPTESIYCFDPDGPAPGGFARADHCDHWHLGYD